MKFTRYSSATKLLEKVESFLMEKEAEYNLPLGVLKQLAFDEGRRNETREEALLILGEDNGKPHVILMQTGVRNLIICGREESLAAAAEWLLSQRILIPGVTGCRNLSEAFAKVWADKANCEWKEVKDQTIYKLEKLREYETKKGQLTLATEDDIALISEWTKEYERDVLGKEPTPNLDFLVAKEIRNNRVFLWRDEDFTPVSMAKRGRDLKSGVVVNFVYTPDEYKGQGYATNCVGALSGRLLNEGFKFCSLNTDASHPTSESIYMKLGYEPVGESKEFIFNYELSI